MRRESEKNGEGGGRVCIRHGDCLGPQTLILKNRCGTFFAFYEPVNFFMNAAPTKGGPQMQRFGRWDGEARVGHGPAHRAGMRRPNSAAPGDMGGGLGEGQ